MRVRRRGFEEASFDAALDAAEAGLREAGSSVVVAFSGGETVEQATALARIVREGLGANTALLPDRWEAGLAAFRAPLSAIQDTDVCLVLGDDPVVERAPIVDLWLRAARRNGAEVLTANPAGDVQVAPGSAAQVCAALRKGGEARRSFARRRRSFAAPSASRSSGRRTTRPAGGTSAPSRATCTRPPRRRSPSTSCHEPPTAAASPRPGRSSGRTPATCPPRGRSARSFVSGDEAAYDPRVADLAGRARFVLATAMFQSDVTALVRTSSSPARATSSGRGRSSTSRAARSGCAAPSCRTAPTSSSGSRALGERFGVAIDPWAAPTAEELAELAPGDEFAWTQPDPQAATGKAAGPGLALVRYHTLFSGPAVERVPQLQFQRPAPEIELAHDDAATREIAAGETVAVSSNGTTKRLRARISRKLRSGVVRVAAEHAEGLEDRVQVEKAGA